MRTLKPNEKKAIERMKDRFFKNEQQLVIPIQEDDVDVVYEGIGYEVVSGENEDELLKLAIAKKLGNNSKLDENLSKVYLSLDGHLLSIYTYEDIIQQIFDSYSNKIPQLVSRNYNHNYIVYGLIINFTEFTLPMELHSNISKKHLYIYEKFLNSKSLIRKVYVLFDNHSVLYKLYSTFNL